MKAPYTIWSLADMLKVSAKGYIDLGEAIDGIRTIFKMAELEAQHEPHGVIRLTEEEITGIKHNLTHMLYMCNQLKLPVSFSLISSRITDEKLPKTAREYEILCDAIAQELKSKLFLFVEPHRAEYYESDDLVSSAVKQAFPTASHELRLAGNCYACDLETSCVFHCMRALEIALRALANELGIAEVKENWKQLIDQCEAEIKKIPNLPKSDEKQQNIQFYSESAVQFRYFKDAWRNYTAHVHAQYSEQQANEIMVHACSFFEILAKKLKEQLP